MNVITFLLANAEAIKTVGGLVIFLVLMCSSSARGAIAAVYEIIKSGVDMNDATALQTASDLMGKKMPYIPEALRKMIIQYLFDSLKDHLKKNEVVTKP